MKRPRSEQREIRVEMARRGFAVGMSMRRPALVAGSLLGLAIATASMVLLTPWMFSAPALHAEFAAQIRELTGLEVVAQGEPVLFFLPRPHFGIEQVSFADPAGGLRLETSRLEGDLRMPALLSGRVEVARVRLTRPQLFVDAEARPLQPASAIGRAALAKSSTSQARSADEVPLGTVELVDGTARIARWGAGEVRIDSLFVTIDWPQLGAAARVVGHLGWHGETASIDAVVDRPVELIRGEPSGLGLHITAPTGSLSFRGLLESRPRPRLTGKLAVAVPSSGRLLALAGAAAAPALPTPFDNLGLSCDATIVDSDLDCTELHLAIDQNNLEGALSVRASGHRPALAATLATDALSLRPFAARFPTLVGRDGQWSRVGFDLRPERLPDLDLRLAAKSLELGRLELADAQVVVHSRAGRLEIGLPSAEAAAGTITGKAVVGVRDSELDIAVEAEFAGVGLSASTRGSLGAWRIAGSMTGAASLTSRGTAMSDLMRNLGGAAKIDLTSGEFAGIDLDRAYHRLHKRPLSLNEELHHGATSFETAHFGLAIDKGIAAVEKGFLRTPLVDLAVAGSADISDRSLDLHAIATPQGALTQESGKFRFDVAGSFDDPLFLPDVDSLIRRSDAAAPLLERGAEASNRQYRSRDSLP
jgi:AsmA protein